MAKKDTTSGNLREVILAELRHWIAEAAPGIRLPGENELCRKYHVSRKTSGAVLNRLEAEGLIERRRGSGTPCAQWRPSGAATPPDAYHRCGSMESAALRAPTGHARPSTARCRFAPSGAASRPRRDQRFRRWTAPGPPSGYGRPWRPPFNFNFGQRLWE